jgi:cellulose synthase/poly-beta-1,6-N-acetylglucosamine synthase-like glycosyltransferase
MNHNKVKVSIGMAAYREEENIKKVLTDILNQTQDETWELTEVLVYVDGKVDATADKAKEVNSKYIRIYEDNERKSKAYRLNQMFKEFSGDILVMFDADIKIKDTSVVSKLVEPFIEDDKVALVGGNSRPFPPQNFFQKAVYSTFKVFYKSRLEINNGNNIFGCTGSILAISQSMAKAISEKLPINEDAYLYMYCVSKGLKFIYVDNAEIYYKMPTNMSDYIRQVLRSEPEAVSLELDKHFGSLTRKEFHRPLGFYALCIFKEFIANPLGVLMLIGVNLFCKAIIPVISKHYKLAWYSAQSTKTI